MMRRVAVFVLMAAGLAAGAFPCRWAAGGAGEQFQVGIAKVDITPPLGYRMSGYFRERRSTGVKDKLYAKAIVFKQGARSAAIIACDVIGVPLSVSRPARQRAAQAIGVKPQHIVVLATHTHTGPLYFGVLRDFFHRKALETDLKDPCEPFDYGKWLTERIVEAAAAAARRLEPARLRAGYAEEHRLSFNRRFHMKDGTVRFNPGQLNPNIVKPAGPIDPQVGIVRIERPGRAKPVAAIVNFALHLDTVGGTEYSADYPKHLEDYLKQLYGPEFTCIFVTGTCGDINHIDVKRRGRRSADQIGRMLGQTVAARMDRLAAVQPDLAAGSRTVRVPLQRFNPEQIAEAERMIEHVADPRVPFLKRVEAYKILAVRKRGGPEIALEVQAIRFGPQAVLVTLPGEVFVELGLAIKRRSNFPVTLVAELANDAPGYIPTEKAFREGSYETVNSRVQPGGGERMVEAAVKLLAKLGE